MPAKRKQNPPTPLSSCENLRSSPRKKPRLSSPSDADIPDSDEIPGSLSDEQELVPPRHSTRNMDAINENVSKWRDDASSVEPSKSPSPEHGTPPPYRHLTPPTSVPARSRSVSPVAALTKDERTAQVLAKIKADAIERAARANLEEEDALPVFKEILSDSDDDLELPSLSNDRKGKGKAADKDKGKGKQKEVWVEVPNRYSFRDTTLAQSPPSSKSAQKRPADRKPSSSKKPATKKSNPFDELLKEKRLAEKHGRDEESRRRAERTASGQDAMMDVDDDNWDADESALFTSSPGGITSDEDLTFDADDERRLYGQTNGAITGIIAAERERQDLAQQEERKLGVPLWVQIDDDTGMDVDEELKPVDFGDLNKYPILHSLHTALQDSRDTQATLLFNSGVLMHLDIPKSTSIIDRVCDIALANNSTVLNQAAFHALLNRWNTTHSGPGISLDTILDVLAEFGADVSKFASSSRPTSKAKSSKRRDVGDREDTLFRMIKLLTASASSQLLDPDDAPDIMLTIVAIVLDASTSPALYRDIMVCADAICCSLSDDYEESKILEIGICNRILEYISDSAAVNQVRAISLLANGSGRTARIARWIAYACISNKTLVTANDYADAPPLEDLFNLLASSLVMSSTTAASASSNPSTSKPIFTNVFKIDLDTNFFEMEYHAQMLDIALSDISSYIPGEATFAASPSKSGSGSLSLSSSSSLGKSESPLLGLRTCIEALHSKINDTRGSRLERSRTKAALKNLSMRIYYQRKAGMSARTRPTMWGMGGGGGGGGSGAAPGAKVKARARVKEVK
ncbi:hypothetical protein VKT23_016277 [Stygiomarasmius scandens]|uniref:Uncharacterized protein n=1 Tax=Marasmiellus scandens TaxID=2682957 RepID=A0ABR1IY16_9AGAR